MTTRGRRRRYEALGYAVLAADMFGEGVAGHRELVDLAGVVNVHGSLATTATGTARSGHRTSSRLPRRL
jgi:hypothetical protein